MTQILRSTSPITHRAIRSEVAPFQAPITSRSLLQAGSTFAIYLATLAVMYVALDVSAWLALAIAPVAAGLTVRLFIIQHDCGHGAMFHRRMHNHVLGTLCSLATLTPYANWRRQHNLHHATWNNLDRRDGGADIYSSCLTVAEYRALEPSKRMLYRLVRHPLIAQLLIPPIVFIALYRVPFDTPRSWRRERASVWLTNLALAGLFGLAVWLMGWRAVLLVHLPVMVLAGIIGVWLFSVQHRFEESRWARSERWDPTVAALGGSSYLKLPQPLQWFTGNIGFHHIHHLAPRVPNYRLAECQAACPALAQATETLTLSKALAAWRYALWDEESGRMVRFPS